MLNLGNRELHKISLWPDSDTTVLVAFELPATQTKDGINYLIQFSDEGKILKEHTFWEPLGPKIQYLFTNHSNDTTYARFSSFYLYYMNEHFEPLPLANLDNSFRYNFSKLFSWQ